MYSILISWFLPLTEFNMLISCTETEAEALNANLVNIYVLRISVLYIELKQEGLGTEL